MGDLIKSKSQSGGITAHTVKISAKGQPPLMGPISKKSCPEKILWIVSGVAAFATVLGYFGLKPGGLMNKEKKETSTIVTSFNQQGGITAGQVNIGKVDRDLTPQLATQLKSVMQTTHQRSAPVMIRMTHQDPETIRFAHKIKSYLTSLGYIAEVPSEIRVYAEDNWPADVNVVPTPNGDIKEIIVTRQK